MYGPSVHDLWSLGHKVVKTDVCSIASDVNGVLTFFKVGFIVSDEKVTVRVDTFWRTFLDIQSNKREFQHGFTGLFRSDVGFRANGCLLRNFEEIWVPYAASFVHKGRRSDGLHSPCHHLHGRCFSKHLEAVEQTHRCLLVQRWPSS